MKPFNFSSFQFLKNFTWTLYCYLLALIRLGFLRVVFSGGAVNLAAPPFPPPPFIFQEELIQYQYNFIELLSNLFNAG